MKMPDTNDKKQLYASKDFVCFGIRNGILLLNKLDKNSKYSPESGLLMKDIHIFKDLTNDAISIIGNLYNTEYLSSVLPFIKIVKPRTLTKYIVKNEDIILKTKWFTVIKKGYYLLKDPVKINRCLLNTPIIISNCYDIDNTDASICESTG